MIARAASPASAEPDFRTADLFIGTTSIVFGLAVATIAIVRWRFFAQTNRARALASFYGESVARGIYVALGAVLIGLGVWVLAG
ncbi:MAG: hypothetical protein U0572_06560 [Phycisphaerales bacterium]